MEIRFEYTDGHNIDFIFLCHALDDFLNEIVGGKKNRAQYVPYNAVDDIRDVVVMYDADKAIGCAGFNGMMRNALK